MSAWNKGSVRVVRRGGRKFLQLRVNVTDRALRYRAQRNVAGKKICGFCGSKRNVEVGHLDGHEEHGEPKNLMWTCRRCNVECGNTLKRHGMGRLTRQYNPADGAKSLAQWVTAVLSMRGESDAMSVPAAVAMIRATSAEKRAQYASEIWRRRRGRRF